MVISNRLLKKVHVEKPKNGVGEMTKTVLLTEEEMFSKGKTFAKLVLHPGCSMGYHEHNGDAEYYYILQGNGEYNCNGNCTSVSTGDLCVVKSGEGHALKNVGDEDGEAIALILYC